MPRKQYFRTPSTNIRQPRCQVYDIVVETILKGPALQRDDGAGSQRIPLHS